MTLKELIEQVKTSTTLSPLEQVANQVPVTYDSGLGPPTAATTGNSTNLTGAISNVTTHLHAKYGASMTFDGAAINAPTDRRRYETYGATDEERTNNMYNLMALKTNMEFVPVLTLSYDEAYPLRKLYALGLAEKRYDAALQSELIRLVPRK